MHEFAFDEGYEDISELNMALPPLITSEMLNFQEEQQKVLKSKRIIPKEVVNALGSELIQAAREGCEDDLVDGFNRAKRLGILKYLSLHIDPATKRTILQTACEAGHGSSIYCILDTYAYLFKGSMKDIRAFFFAMDNDHFDVCQTLLLHWKVVDEDAKITDYHTIGCILPFACDRSTKRIVELLLDYGGAMAINLTTHSAPNRNPLRIAVLKGKLDIVELLIERGAEVGPVVNVVYDAMDSKSVATLRFVLEHFPLDNLQDAKYALAYACHQGYHTMIRFMIEEEEVLKDDANCWKEFEQRATTDLCSVLAELGCSMNFDHEDVKVDVSFIEDMQATLGPAAMKTMSDRFFSSFNRNPASLLDFRSLLRTGKVCDLPIQKLVTLANLSLSDERSVILCTLLAIGLLEEQALTNINVSASLNNILINACKAKDWTLAEYLLDSGAHFKINSRLRGLLSDLLYEADHIVDLIVMRSKSFDVNAVDGTGAFASGETLLMLLCSIRLVHSAEILLHAGADVNVCDSSGSTALHHVAKGLTSLSRYSVGFAFEVLKAEKIIRLLLLAGADPTTTNRYRSSAAMIFKKELRQDKLAKMLEEPDLSPLDSSHMDIDELDLY